MVLQIDITPLNQWMQGGGRPFIISGPCSAESEEQVMKTAITLAGIKEVKAFRAGIWKPRTRPGTFEGVGSKGLKWLRKVKEETGLLIATEVANEKHVFEAIKYGVDILWIGARTSVNPFTVQEIADALAGTDVIVLIKNPVNPDIDLWTGAIERIASAGIKRIGAIHRGFSTFEKTAYRNQPNWQIPIELRRRIPGLPIICDPSHIGGARKYIFELSQKAMDLNFDGLIIESHYDPEKALSDAAQQITPDELVEVLARLVLRNPDPADPKLLDTLGELRQQIDVFDDHLIELLEQRMQIADRIGEFKKHNNITVLQSARWDEVISKAVVKGRDKGLSADLIDAVFKAIHQESINRQIRIINKDMLNNKK